MELRPSVNPSDARNLNNQTLTQLCARMRRYNMITPQAGRPDDNE